MTRKVIIETDRLFLREMDMDDYPSLYPVLSDADIMKHYPYVFDKERIRSWIERNRIRYREDGFGLWAVCLKETGEMIGDCGLTLQNIDGEMLPEIGYHIRADHQRKGYAGEAAKAVLDWAFRNTEYPAIYSYCKYTNTASIKTAESIGMHFEKEYPDPVNEFTHVSVIERGRIIAACGNEIEKNPRRSGMKQLFESDHISFVEVSELLVKDYLGMVNDYENVNRFIGGKKKAFTEEQELTWVREKLEEKAPVYSMIEKKSGRFIGNIEFMGLSETEAELGIAITGEMQNRGFGTEAVSAMVQYGFDYFGLKRVFLRTNPDNARAFHVYEKCGFVEYDRTDEHISMEIYR